VSLGGLVRDLTLAKQELQGQVNNLSRAAVVAEKHLEHATGELQQARKCFEAAHATRQG
jgi:hypothetical protein